MGKDEQHLHVLLLDLCSLQDIVTHCNEAGQVIAMREAQIDRRLKIDEIVRFVSNLLPYGWSEDN